MGSDAPQSAVPSCTDRRARASPVHGGLRRFGLRCGGRRLTRERVLPEWSMDRLPAAHPGSAGVGRVGREPSRAPRRRERGELLSRHIRDSRRADVPGTGGITDRGAEPFARGSAGWRQVTLGSRQGTYRLSIWGSSQRLSRGASFAACESLFDEARKVKSGAEIEILAGASLATEEALLSTFRGTGSGESERSIAQRFGSSLLLGGADRIGFMFLPPGTRTGYAHPTSTDDTVREGDLIKADVGGVFSGYFSDRARTTVVGTPSGEQRDMYSRLAEAHRETIAAIRPGCFCTYGVRDCTAAPRHPLDPVPPSPRRARDRAGRA